MAHSDIHVTFAHNMKSGIPLHTVLLNKLCALSECHHTVEIMEDVEQEIIFPIHMPCYPRAYCDLNIRNNQIMKVL